MALKHRHDQSYEKRWTSRHSQAQWARNASIQLLFQTMRNVYCLFSLCERSHPCKTHSFIAFILSHSVPHVHAVRRSFALYILNRHFWRHDLMSLNNAFSQLHDVFTHHYLHFSLHFFQRIFSAQPVSPNVSSQHLARSI